MTKNVLPVSRAVRVRIRESAPADLLALCDLLGPQSLVLGATARPASTPSLGEKLPNLL